MKAGNAPNPAALLAVFSRADGRARGAVPARRARPVVSVEDTGALAWYRCGRKLAHDTEVVAALPPLPSLA